MIQNKHKKKAIKIGLKESINLKTYVEMKFYQYINNINSFLSKSSYIFIIILLSLIYNSFIVKISKIKKTVLFMDLIILFSLMFISKEDNILQLNNINEIKITIKGNGTQMILSDYTFDFWDRTLSFNNLPNEIIINNEPQYYTGKYVYNLTNEYNNITMRWNNPFFDTNVMFYKMDNIISFDFSKFDTKGVTEMMLMFRENNITKLDLSSFNTESVVTMAGMFEFCRHLISLDISNFNTPLVTSFEHTFRNLCSLTSLDVGHLITGSATIMTGMFEENHVLKSLNLKKFDTSKVVTMWCMFCGSKSLKFLDLSNFDTRSVESMYQMFKNCHSLISININNFNTQKVLAMNEMFLNCTSLISLNLNNFIISNKTNCTYMFFGINSKLKYCLDSIISISKNIIKELPRNNIKNCSDSCFSNKQNKFLIQDNKCIDNCTKDEKYIYEYNYICYESCPKRTNVLPDNKNLCIDLLCEYKNKYYNYSQMECLDDIPDRYYLNDSIEKTIDECDITCKRCEDKSLCISCNNNDNYYPILNDTLNNNSFINCYNEIPEGYALEDNIYKPCYYTCKNCSKIGNETNHECTSCKSGYDFNIFEKIGNCYNICEFYYYLDDMEKFHCTSEKKCPENFNKLIKEKNKCIDNCSKDNIYKYEYNFTCLEFLPTDVSMYTTDYLIETTNIITLNITEIVNNSICLPLDFLSKKCKLNDPTKIDKMIEDIRNGIKSGNLNDLIEDILENDKDLVIEGEDMIFQLTSSESQNNKIYDNISIIKLGQCGKLLCEENNMNENENLLIFKIDIKEEGLSIPLVEYEIYDYNKKKQLDLNICDETNNKIEIFFPTSNVQNEIFKHNISSDYFNDICFSYTTAEGTDIILNDRKNEFIDKNMSLCDTSCNLIEYSKETNMSKCECEVKIKIPLIKEITIDKREFMKNFKNINNIMNIQILKCYKELFSSEGLKKKYWQLHYIINNFY